jgi:hypothetical protein
LRRLTYRPEGKTLARLFGLRTAFRNLYYRLARPKNGVVTIEVGRLSAQFVVHTPSELRNLDPAGQIQNEEYLLQLLISAAREGDTFFDSLSTPSGECEAQRRDECAGVQEGRG